jgi:hypothetical protein
LSVPVDSPKDVIKIIGQLNGYNGLLAIDGVDGLGKSTIAKLLSEAICVGVVSLDDFIIKNTGEYVNSIEASLKSAITCLKGQGVIEGVCIMEALKKIQIYDYKTVYLKRMHHGIWVDEKNFTSEFGAEAAIQKEVSDLHKFEAFFAARGNREMNPREEIKLPALTCEIIRYHHNFQPHKNADFIYEVAHA